MLMTADLFTVPPHATTPLVRIARRATLAKIVFERRRAGKQKSRRQARVAPAKVAV